MSSSATAKKIEKALQEAMARVEEKEPQFQMNTISAAVQRQTTMNNQSKKK